LDGQGFKKRTGKNPTGKEQKDGCVPPGVSQVRRALKKEKLKRSEVHYRKIPGGGKQTANRGGGLTNGREGGGQEKKTRDNKQTDSEESEGKGNSERQTGARLQNTNNRKRMKPHECHKKETFKYFESEGQRKERKVTK